MPHCHILRSLPVLLRNKRNCTLPVSSGATYWIQTHSNKCYEQHRVYNIALRDLTFEGLKRQRGAVSKSYSLLSRFFKNRVVALSWVLQRNQNARSNAEPDAILFLSKVQDFKFNVSSVVKFFCLPVCWYTLMWLVRYFFNSLCILLHNKVIDEFNTFVQLWLPYQSVRYNCSDIGLHIAINCKPIFKRLKSNW